MLRCLAASAQTGPTIARSFLRFRPERSRDFPKQVNIVTEVLRRAPIGRASARLTASAAAPAVDGAASAIGWWLAGMSGAVFGMVAVGGYTRLTRSGLSMTEWRLTGSKLPSTVAEWTVEFEKYKKTPEFLKLNKGMNLEEFKSIYFWEWFHRMWGRSLGVLFVVPAAVFLARKPTRTAFSRLGLYPRLATLFALGGTQGLVGWWMVKSGLDHTHVFGIERDPDDMPRVSPYRLATHLSFAFVTYGLLAWTSMGLLANSATLDTETQRIASLKPSAIQSLRRFRTAVHGTCGLIGVTIFSGAFVAGNLAGLVYGDWPLMGGQFVPAGIKEEWNRYTPRVRNLFENIALVQFDHRMLAYSTLAAGTGVLAVATRLRKILPTAALFRSRLLAGVLWTQASVGIATILYNVPVELGVLHQTGALTAWTVSLWLLHALRPIAAGVALAGTGGAAAAMAAAGCLVSVDDGLEEEDGEDKNTSGHSTDCQPPHTVDLH